MFVVQIMTYFPVSTTPTFIMSQHFFSNSTSIDKLIRYYAVILSRLQWPSYWPQIDLILAITNQLHWKSHQSMEYAESASSKRPIQCNLVENKIMPPLCRAVTFINHKSTQTLLIVQLFQFIFQFIITNNLLRRDEYQNCDHEPSTFKSSTSWAFLFCKSIMLIRLLAAFP